MPTDMHDAEIEVLGRRGDLGPLPLQVSEYLLKVIRTAKRNSKGERPGSPN